MNLVVIFGPPGAGKSTQAKLLAEQKGLFWFDSGKFLEALVGDPARLKEKRVREARKIFKAGGILPTPLIIGEVLRETKRLYQAGLGIVFSGSPRLLPEAQGELPIWEKLYGRKNIFFFLLDLDERTAIKRNSDRLVCKVCKNPYLSKYSGVKNPKHCMICGGPLYKRTLDNPIIMRERLRQYKKRTAPIIGYLRSRGYKIIRIDATPAPYKIFTKILKIIEKAS